MPVFLWTQKQDIGASSRAGHAMAYDAARKQTVLFGGSRSSSLLGDTWAWADDLWTQVADTGPTARDGCAMSYDASRQRVMLFGGHSGGTQFGDTWQWDGEDWTQVADTGPEPRAGVAMVFGGTTVVLFGGVNSVDESIPVASHKVFGDTWQWDGSEWTQIQDMGPKGRWQHAMAFERTESRIVLFGGLTLFAPAGDPSLAEALLGDTWVHNEPGGPPPGPLPVPPPVVVESAVTIQGSHLGTTTNSILVGFNLSNSHPLASVDLITKVVQVDLNGETASPLELSHLRVEPEVIRLSPGEAGGTFHVERDPGFMHPGTYGIQVAVQGTATEHDPGKVVTFTVA